MHAWTSPKFSLTLIMETLKINWPLLNMLKIYTSSTGRLRYVSLSMMAFTPATLINLTTYSTCKWKKLFKIVASNPSMVQQYSLNTLHKFLCQISLIQNSCREKELRRSLHMSQAILQTQRQPPEA